MTLEELIEWARGYKMTDAEREEQRISFAYGNVAIENPGITKDDVRRAAANMRAQ